MAIRTKSDGAKVDLAIERLIIAQAKRAKPRLRAKSRAWLEHWTPDYLRGLFAYNPDSGRLSWRKNGKEAGWTQVIKMPLPDGNWWLYKIRILEFDGSRARAHRVIWAMHTGELPGDFEVDHQDGNGINNRFSNLRLVDGSGNSKNTQLKYSNTTGHHGITYNPRSMKWSARIMVNGALINLGTFYSLDDAVACRKKCEDLAEFHSNHGRVGPSQQAIRASKER